MSLATSKNKIAELKKNENALQNWRGPQIRMNIIIRRLNWKQHVVEYNL